MFLLLFFHFNTELEHITTKMPMAVYNSLSPCQNTTTGHEKDQMKYFYMWYFCILPE